MYLRSLLRCSILTILAIQISADLTAKAQTQASCVFTIFDVQANHHRHAGTFSQRHK
jgi:hypothetical protein